MSTPSLRRLISYRLEQLGKPGLVGVGMLLLAGLLWAVQIQKTQDEIIRSKERLSALQQQTQTRSNLPVDAALDREQQLQVFYAGFPAADKVNVILQSIYKAAEKRDLMLETGEYAWVQNGSDPIARYKVTLPVKGAFGPLLEFVDAVLQENSTVALESLTIKRDKVEVPVLEAKLTFTLFVAARK